VENGQDSPEELTREDSRQQGQNGHRADEASQKRQARADLQASRVIAHVHERNDSQIIIERDDGHHDGHEDHGRYPPRCRP